VVVVDLAVLAAMAAASAAAEPGATGRISTLTRGLAQGEPEEKNTV
jgi:hypothetical protein